MHDASLRGTRSVSDKIALMVVMDFFRSLQIVQLTESNNEESPISPTDSSLLLNYLINT
jgi:hypothetical protein